MANRSSSSKVARLARRMTPLGTIAMLGLLCGGCSSSAQPPQTAAIQKAELHFSLDQCQPLDSNLYKCPAIDKPVCNPDYNGSLECVRIGPKGSVYIESSN